MANRGQTPNVEMGSDTGLVAFARRHPIMTAWFVYTVVSVVSMMLFAPTYPGPSPVTDDALLPLPPGYAVVSDTVPGRVSAEGCTTGTGGWDCSRTWRVGIEGGVKRSTVAELIGHVESKIGGDLHGGWEELTAGGRVWLSGPDFFVDFELIGGSAIELRYSTGGQASPFARSDQVDPWFWRVVVPAIGFVFTAAALFLIWAFDLIINSRRRPG